MLEYLLRFSIRRNSIIMLAVLALAGLGIWNFTQVTYWMLYLT
jgi:Putative silver efflux pump